MTPPFCVSYHAFRFLYSPSPPNLKMKLVQKAILRSSPCQSNTIVLLPRFREREREREKERRPRIREQHLHIQRHREMEAPVLYKDKNSVLRFSVDTKLLSICSGADRMGKNTVVWSCKLNCLINIETTEERQLRQQKRCRECISGEISGGTAAEPCADNTEEEVGCFARRKPSKGAASTVVSVDPSEEKNTLIAPQTYFIHYVSTKNSPATVVLTSRGGEEQVILLAKVVEGILAATYVSGYKQMIAFVSPVSGAGKAKKMWEKDVYPILTLSKHSITAITTERQAHCEDYVADLKNNMSAETCVIAIGGDGMMHEAVNGLQRRRAALSALNKSEDEIITQSPLLATIPAGSGCALAKFFNILETVDSAKALVHLNTTLIDLFQIEYVPCEHNFVPTAQEIKDAKSKGKPAPTPYRAVTTCTDPPRAAFLNVCFAITNEIDRGSEHMRWMGNARFTVRAMQLLAAGIPLYKCTVRYVPWAHPATGENVEKRTNADTLRGNFPRCNGRDSCSHCVAHRTAVKRPREEFAAEEWVTVKEDRFAMLMLNNLQDAARDMAIAPLAHVGDGCIDLVYNGKVPGEPGTISRSDFVKVFLGLEEGSHIKDPNVKYIKARAVEVLPEDGTVMADGEVIPTSGVRVTTIPAAVRVVRSL